MDKPFATKNGIYTGFGLETLLGAQSEGISPLISLWAYAVAQNLLHLSSHSTLVFSEVQDLPVLN
jgi:hypothetical protein